MSGRLRILIVDDDAFIRRPLEFFLTEEGYQADTAVDGHECLEKVALQRPDLIFLDVMMPGLDGFSVCQALKRDRRYADIPIIMLSARGQEHDRARGLAAGADEYLTKPYSPSELLRRIRQMLSN